MNAIKAEIEKRLNTTIMREIETDEIIAFEVRINKKVFNFYQRKNEHIMNHLLAFIYRIEKVLA